jgi:Na+/H+-dicarboxylate symporter
MRTNRMTTYILVGMIMGIAAGWLINAQFPHDAATGLVVDPTAKAPLAKYAGYFSIISNDIFLRLIKMIIAPLVFSTLVVGIGHMSDLGTIGRVGGKAMLWFITASLVSLSLGLVLANWFEPGVGMNQVVTGAKTSLQTDSMTLKNFVEHVFPSPPSSLGSTTRSFRSSFSRYFSESPARPSVTAQNGCLRTSSKLHTLSCVSPATS